jgi:hypothetical protein
MDARELRTAMRAMGVELSADDVRALMRGVGLSETQALDFSVSCRPTGGCVPLRERAAVRRSSSC